MTNVKFDKVEDYQDVQSTGLYYSKLEQGMAHDDIMEIIWATARGNSRTPMQWSQAVNGGFTTGTPWIKVNQNYQYINVKNQVEDPDSILQHYRQLIELRRFSSYKDVIVYGDYTLLNEHHPNVYAYLRTYENKKLLVVSNFFEQPAIICLTKWTAKKILLSNYKDSSTQLGCLSLRPYESIVFEIES